jgi:hypothetical protein
MNTDKIARYVWKGRHDARWYHQAEELFVDLFGRDRLQLVTRLFAATSINTSLKANITLFRRALYEIENGLPSEHYLPNIRKQIEQVRAGNELTGRKINSFARAMAGDPDAVVVDVWLLRAFGEDRKYFRKDPKTRGEKVLTLEQYVERYGAQLALPGRKPEEFSPGARIPQGGHAVKLRGLYRSGGASDAQYTRIENYVRQEAQAMGVQARQLSAMIWSGVRIDQSGDRETHYSTILQSHFHNLYNVI